MKPNLLIVSHVDPTQRRSGQEQRVYYSLQALRHRFRTRFLGVAPPENLAGYANSLRQICDEVAVLPSVQACSHLRRVWHRVAGLLYQTRSGLKFSNYLVGQLEFHPRRVRSVLAGNPPDVALFEYFHAFPAARVLQAQGIRCALDTHNVLWQSFARQLSTRGRGTWLQERILSRYRSAEESAWSAFDCLIAISAGERDYISERLAHHQRLIYAPMGIPLEDWPYSWQPANPPRIAYYGGLAGTRNSTEARRCHDHIMPLIWRTHPKVEYWMVGSSPPEGLKLLADLDPRVHVTGFLNRVQPVLRTMTLLLCPFSGTYGFRSRLIEAMGLGVPVIASPDAVHGMDLTAGAGLLLASSDQEFASIASHLLSNHEQASRQSLAARSQVAERLSFQATYGHLASEMLDWASAVPQRRTCA